METNDLTDAKCICLRKSASIARGNLAKTITQAWSRRSIYDDAYGDGGDAGGDACDACESGGGDDGDEP